MEKLNEAWTKVSVQRLGPVKDASITIRPITINHTNWEKLLREIFTSKPVVPPIRPHT